MNYAIIAMMGFLYGASTGDSNAQLADRDVIAAQKIHNKCVSEHWVGTPAYDACISNWVKVWEADKRIADQQSSDQAARVAAGMQAYGQWDRERVLMQQNPQMTSCNKFGEGFTCVTR